MILKVQLEILQMCQGCNIIKDIISIILSIIITRITLFFCYDFLIFRVEINEWPFFFFYLPFQRRFTNYSPRALINLGTILYAPPSCFVPFRLIKRIHFLLKKYTFPRVFLRFKQRLYVVWTYTKYY